MPLIAFAIVSPLVHLLSRRIGIERTLLVALGVLIAATILRSIPGGTSLLWIGTALIGCAIAVGNVLIPAVVKRDFPNKIALMTASTPPPSAPSLLPHPAWPCLSPRDPAGASLWPSGSSSASSPPSLGCRAGCGASRSLPPSGPGQGRCGDRPPPGRSRCLWAARLAFYSLITWLPSIPSQQRSSIPSLPAGTSSSTKPVGIAAGLGVTGFMHGRSNLRVVAATVSALMIVAMTGLALFLISRCYGSSSPVSAPAPQASSRSPWSLNAHAHRRTPDAGRLSGMVQSIGYVLAALGPAAGGALFELTGSFNAILWSTSLIALARLIIAYYHLAVPITHD